MTTELTKLISKLKGMGVKWVGGEGPLTPKIILIGEAPGGEEEFEGRPFVGPSGKISDQIISLAGLRREDCFIDNVVGIRPPSNHIEELYKLGVTIDDFLPTLAETLKKVDCKVVVAYGETALNHLTGYEGISKHRGSIYPCLLDDRKLVIPTFHPRFVIENWRMKGVVVEDIKKALRIGSGGRREYKFTTLIKPTLMEVENGIKEIAEMERWSFDIETVGSGQIACVGIGADFGGSRGMHSICIPFKFGYNNYWEFSDEVYIWKMLQDLFLSGEGIKIGQNINFDLTKLLPFLGEPSSPWCDLMVAYHLLEPELPHSLAFMTSIFTDINYYKDDPKDEDLSWKYTTSSEQLWDYNCLMYGNHILTEQGPLAIEEIVRYKMDIKVLSLNERTGELEYKRIINWHKKKERNQSWIRISIKSNKRGLVVTPDHKVRLRDRWVEAKDVKKGDQILINEKELTPDELGFIVGTLFGDSSFGGKKSEELAYIQCYQKDESLINLKKNLLSNISLATTPFNVTNCFKPGKRFSFISRSLYQLEFLRKALIIKGIKRPYLLDCLTPKGLAVWYMDDGCIVRPSGNRQYKASLALHGFEPQDRSLIQEWFIQRYMEPATLTKVGALIMSVGMSKKFCDEISPFIIPELRYKLPYQQHEFMPFTLEHSNKPASALVLLVEDYKDHGKRHGINETRYCITVEDNHNFFTSFGLVANCKDVAVNLILYPELMRELKEMGLLNRYLGFDMPKMRVYWRMQQRGIMVDEEVRQRLIREEASKWVEKQLQLNQKVGYELNPNSNKQMVKFLYEDLKLPPHHNRKSKQLTADEKTLKTLSTTYQKPELLLAVSIRKLIKNIGTYLARKDQSTGEYTETRIDQDGRMRGRYNICGTETGRASSKKTYDDTGIDQQNIPEYIRQMFTAPEGKVLMGFDQWQAETFPVAVMSESLSFLARLREGKKVHSLVGGWIFDKSEDDLTPLEYRIAKRTVHGKNYGLGAKKFMEDINEDIIEINEGESDPSRYLPFYTLAQCKALMAKFDRFAPEIEKWHRDIQEELTRTRMLITPMGRKRVFRGRLGEDLFREGYAHIPQSTIAENNQLAMIKIEYSLPEGAEIIQDGFDSILVEVILGQEEKVEKIVRFGYQKDLFWKGEKFNIPVESAGVGKFWKK